jgi:hypothetical protein
MREQNARIELKRIGVDDLQSFVAETRAQKICKSRILLDGENVRAFLEQKFRQRT